MVTGKLSKYRFICFTDTGRKLMEKLGAMLSGELSFQYETKFNDSSTPVEFAKCSDAKAFVESSFCRGNVLIFIGAAGIAVRLIAPFIKDKASDPAVIVIDENGQFVIPILSGHIGGGVEEARKIAALLEATPVITTATDVRGLFAVDVFASENDFYISDMKKTKEFTAGLLRNGTAFYCVDSKYKQYIHVDTMPEEIREADGLVESGDVISVSSGSIDTFLISPAIPDNNTLTLVPKCIVLGIGCKKRTDTDKLHSFVLRCIENAGLSIHSLKAITSIDLKAEEAGLCDLSRKLNVPFVTFPAEVLMEQAGDFSTSQFVRSTVGADNVCERSVIAYGCRDILVRKTAEDGMTFAAGIMEIKL